MIEILAYAASFLAGAWVGSVWMFLLLRREIKELRRAVTREFGTIYVDPDYFNYN